jgi:hypothetical protein
LDPTRTYSDDIIFDNAPPAIRTASATTKSPRAAKISTWRLTTKAKDDRSGVATLQVTPRPTAKAVFTGSYRKAITVRTKPKVRRLFVRVSDNAGNWSDWKTVKVVKQAKEKR